MSWSLRDENVLVRRFSVKGKEICVIGNFNLTYRDSYYTKFGRDRVEDSFSECGIRVKRIKTVAYHINYLQNL